MPGPLPKQPQIDIALVDCQNGTGRKDHRPGDLHFMDFAVRNMGKHRQIAVMIQKHMKFHSAFGLAELGPSKRLAYESITVASRLKSLFLNRNLRYRNSTPLGIASAVDRKSFHKAAKADAALA